MNNDTINYVRKYTDVLYKNYQEFNLEKNPIFVVMGNIIDPPGIGYNMYEIIDPLSLWSSSELYIKVKKDGYIQLLNLEKIRSYFNV